jgi:hypothetical protein
LLLFLDPGSGINIPDPQHWLLVSVPKVKEPEILLNKNLKVSFCDRFSFINYTVTTVFAGPLNAELELCNGPALGGNLGEEPVAVTTAGLTNGQPASEGKLVVKVRQAVLRVSFKGTVRPDWICMRVVSLGPPLKGHQPLCFLMFNF